MIFRAQNYVAHKAGILFGIEQRVINGKPQYVAIVNGIAYGGDPTRQAAIDRMYRRLATASVGL